MPDVTPITHTAQGIALFVLVLVALFGTLARRWNVSYPILLVIAGLVLSFVPHVPHVRLEPQLVFNVALPPLLYAASWNINWPEFRRQIVSISMLATGLVLFTVLSVAFFADHFISAFDFRSGFLLGAIVAATDAVAATSIANSLGLERLLSGHDPTVGASVQRLLWLIVGGGGTGLLLGWVMAWVERWVDEGPIEMVVSLIVPYVAYFAAEELRSSGVLAVVACGIFLSRKSATYLSPGARLELLSAWRALDFLMNGVLFALIGLQLPYILDGIRGYSVGTLILYGVVFSALLIALRMAWVFPGAKVSFWLRRRIFKTLPAELQMPPARSIFMVGWMGMRGVVSLAAALSLPETLPNGQPFEQRNLILFLTFTIIFVTLVVQGLGLPPLIRRLGLGGGDHAIVEERRYALRVLSESAISFLDAKRVDANHELAHDIDDLKHKYEHRLEATRHGAGTIDEDEEQRLAGRARQRLDLIRGTITVEREALMELRNASSVGDEVIRSMERDLDLAESRSELQESEG
jgi:CPA1 family monovalent cation:H+ antiporter